MARPISVLLVEDEPIIALDLRNMLKKLGIGVCAQASSGNSALEMAKLHNPDAVLMDIMLEGELDGIDTATQISGLYSIPVIFITAYTDDKTRARAALSSPKAFLAKPVDLGDLREAFKGMIA